MTVHADRYIATLALARDCVALGARRSTVMMMTGLPESTLVSLFPDCEGWRPNGRTPVVIEWFFRTNLRGRIHAAVFTSLLARLLEDRTVDASRALVSAYRCYRVGCAPDTVLSFNLAFHLACNLFGRWLMTSPLLRLHPCPACAREFLVPATAPLAADCPFCQLVKRYARDPRLEQLFPEPAVRPTPPDVVALLALAGLGNN